MPSCINFDDGCIENLQTNFSRKNIDHIVDFFRKELALVKQKYKDYESKYMNGNAGSAVCTVQANAYKVCLWPKRLYLLNVKKRVAEEAHFLIKIGYGKILHVR